MTKCITQASRFLSHSKQNVGRRLSMKKGAHRITNVKNTTPSTLVAFCSKRIILPCLDEFLDITLEFLEWCDRTLLVNFPAPELYWYRCNRHGDEGFLFRSLSVVVLPFCLSVADRRSKGVFCEFAGECVRSELLVLPKLDPETKSNYTYYYAWGTCR